MSASTGEIARYWIETDMASAILTRVRNELAARRNVFLQVFKGTSFRCEPGAPYAWLELPEQWQAGRFVRALAARRVRVTPGSAFLLDGSAAAAAMCAFASAARIGVQTRKALRTHA